MVDDVRITDVVCKDALYPRVVTDAPLVERYCECLDALPPIALNQDNWLIDGKHRLDAHKKMGRTTIRAVRQETDGIVDFLAKSCRANTAHGKALTRLDREKAVILLFREAGEHADTMAQAFERRAAIREQMPEIFGVSEHTITKDLNGMHTGYIQARQTKIKAMLKEGALTHEQIANAVGVRRPVVTEIFAKMEEKNVVSLPIGGKTTSPPPPSPSVPKPVTPSQAVREVVTARKEDLLPEDNKAHVDLREGKITADVFRDRIVRNSKKREMKKAQAKLDRTMPKHNGRFDVIDIDPPWPMEKIEMDVRKNQTGFDYPVMSLDQIRALKLPVAERGAHIFLWTTQKFLPVAFECFARWDVRYSFTMVWAKPPGKGMRPFNFPLYNNEFCVYGRIGKPEGFIDTKGFQTLFKGAHRGHSRKPLEFYDMITRATLGHRAVLFGREAIDGWHIFGNEAGKFDEEGANGNGIS